MERIVNKLYDLFTLDKPTAASWEEWEEWENYSKTNKPLAYFLNETVPNWFNKFVSPFKHCQWWIRYRIFDHYHIINTGLKPGYYDTDTRILHGMFNLLVDHVEVEKAWMHVAFDNKAKYSYKYPWWSFGLTRFKSFRNPQAGLDHLEWEISLDDPTKPEVERSESQAKYAKEIKILYDWWKNIRPNRPDPYEASGWSAYCEQHRNKTFLSFLDSNKKEARRILDECHRIEKSYDDEDQEMLIRLVKIRKGLWT